MADRLPWTSSPDYRGTLNILWTCLSTIGLGAFTAIHPNVRADGKWLNLTLQRVGEMMLATVLPEIIICSAWQQLLTARRICNELIKLRKPGGPLKPSDPHMESDWENRVMLTKRAASRDSFSLGSASLNCAEAPSDLCDETLNELSRQSTQNEDVVTRRLEEGINTTGQGNSNETKGIGNLAKWSMGQAFFVTMGGIIVKTPELGAQHFTAEGILTLAKVGLLPNLSDKDVKDRNKADSIAKGLVVIQLSWFLLQVLSRLVSGLPVTLLEAHTSVNVGFTTLIFALWFKKPYNVQYPIPLQDNDSIDMACLFEIDARRRQAFDAELGQHKLQRETFWTPPNSDSAQLQFGLDQHQLPASPKLEPLTESLRRLNLGPDDLDIQNHETRSQSSQDLNVSTVLQGARRAIHRLRRYNYSTEMIDSQRWDFLRSSSVSFTIGSTWGAWSEDKGHGISLDMVMHMIFNILYGAGHMAAWRSTSFPTTQEMWMWRASAIMLFSVPVWGFLWIWWWKAVGSTRKLLWPFRNGDIDHVAAPLFLNVICGYIFARCFFLVECLVSLRSQPAGAYQIEQWTTMVPHVG
ncbi:MAG: hypothetical protein Q9160_001840 [Pyrenula sp. 1 TL-2023]